MRFGIGFAVLILIHEMGHFIDIKRLAWLWTPAFAGVLPGLEANVTPGMTGWLEADQAVAS